MYLVVSCCVECLHAGILNSVTTFRGNQTHGRVPTDTFAVRIAIVRAEMGWNYDQAAKATGIGSETWRLWEKRKRQCTTLEQTCRKIADATGFSYEWLMIGGPLGPAADPLAAAISSGWNYRNGRMRRNSPRRLVLCSAA